jgi:hypothetical protein
MRFATLEFEGRPQPVVLSADGESFCPVVQSGDAMKSNIHKIATLTNAISAAPQQTACL